MAKKREKIGQYRVAKLVTVSLTTRVIVSATADDYTAYEKAAHRLMEKLQNEGIQNIDKVVLDTECPFGTFDDDNLKKWD